MKGFQYSIDLDEDGLTVHLSGSINENTDLSKIQIEESKFLRLDMSGIKTLNSMGLRNWVLWMKTFKGRHQMAFRNCPRTVIEQMNILQGFLPAGAIVESFAVPYVCPHCSHEENFLALRGRDYMEGTVDTKEGAHLPNTRPCSACGKEAELDVVLEKYIGFLKYRRQLF